MVWEQPKHPPGKRLGASTAQCGCADEQALHCCEECFGFFTSPAEFAVGVHVHVHPGMYSVLPLLRPYYE